MIDAALINSLARLKNYCEQQQFKGWDPYDGLNSRLFRAIPGANSSPLCRLVMIQACKRSPINMRPLLLVPRQYNAKGIGLLLQGYCNLLEAINHDDSLTTTLGSRDDILARIEQLAQLLLELRSTGDYHGACWGYNFDWQARNGLYFKRGTPTVVATTFAATALLSAATALDNTHYRDIALTAGEFVLNDLNRTPCADGFLFSYAPIPGNDTVYNASLLGSQLLSVCYHYNPRDDYREAAAASVRACCAGQQADGSWVYGMEKIQSWVDSFHTGYNLVALDQYERFTGDTSFHDALERGMDYYLAHFFEPDGTPWYYNNRKYPIDIHCPAQLLVTLVATGRLAQHQQLPKQVTQWTIDHMQHRTGYFYYQLKKGISSRVSYMRWSNAFMFNALTAYLKGLTSLKKT